jgi:hypothetical protein
MMSRFTKAVLWGWLYLPIGFTIFLLTFKIRPFDRTWQTPAEKGWEYVAVICMIAGILSVLLTPICLIHDIARGKRKKDDYRGQAR